MSDQFTDVSSHSLMDNLGDSIKGVLVGLLMFVLSFPILWWNEGRVDPSSVAKNAVVVAADGSKTDGEGKLVAIEGDLKALGTLGDPEFLAEGPYIRLHRDVEMWAWVETKKSETKKKLGGGSETTTTYTYDLKWTSSVHPASDFKYPAKHVNPALTYEEKSFSQPKAAVGAFTFDAGKIQLPSSEPITIADGALVSGAKGRVKKASDKYLFAGIGSLENPALGDVRISYEGVLPKAGVTLYGERHGKEVQSYDWHDGEVTLFRVITGTHKEALKTMHGEHVMMTWILRIVGFVFMWFGLASILGPVHAVLDILPFLGSTSRFLVSLVLFPISFILTLIVIVMSNVAHSPILMLLVIGAVVGGGMYWVKNKKKPAPSAPPPPVA